MGQAGFPPVAGRPGTDPPSQGANPQPAPGVFPGACPTSQGPLQCPTFEVSEVWSTMNCSRERRQLLQILKAEGQDHLPDALESRTGTSEPNPPSSPTHLPPPGAQETTKQEQGIWKRLSPCREQSGSRPRGPCTGGVPPQQTVSIMGCSEVGLTEFPSTSSVMVSPEAGAAERGLTGGSAVSTLLGPSAHCPAAPWRCALGRRMGRPRGPSAVSTSALRARGHACPSMSCSL